MGKFTKFVRSFDDFGESPKLIHKGKDKYKTKLGGVISILVKVFILYFAVVKIKSLVTKDDPEIQTSESFENRSLDSTAYNLKDNSFGFLFFIHTKEPFMPVEEIPPNIG